ncbi:hypothetical protein [Paenibacillus sp. JCM 10914]|nr:hypothetical protein [Paenibacillus sp. JCM 10914]
MLKPDTHVIQTTIRLGLLDADHAGDHAVQGMVNQHGVNCYKEQN